MFKDRAKIQDLKYSLCGSNIYLIKTEVGMLESRLQEMILRNLVTITDVNKFLRPYECSYKIVSDVPGSGKRINGTL